MTEETVTTSQPSETPKPAPKGSLLKYILLGVIGLVLVLGVAAATIMVLGRTPAATPTDSTAVAHNDSTSASGSPSGELTDDEILDSLMSLEDGDSASVLALIEENLAVLDVDPDSFDLTGESGGLSQKDSLEGATWLTQEKQRLSTWETQLNDRQQSLSRREEEISRKMLVIERAESARVMELAKLYDNMDSRAVAKLMANLDDETVVSILPRMKGKNASQVLQLLPAPRAAKLSKQMITIAEN